MKDYTDDVLWQKVLEGDNTAFGILMSRYFRVLYQYGCKFSKDESFVKDSIQDLFLMLWERRQNLSKQVNIKPYLMASLRRSIHRHYLRNKEIFAESFEADSSLFDLEFSVETQYIETESINTYTQHIKSLLEKLPQRQKEVVYLRFFQNLERDEISQIMSIAPQTVSNILQMALKQLRSNWNIDLLLMIMVSFLFF
jgi:RNA polymerase sigma factor (sigma-70 family)